MANGLLSQPRNYPTIVSTVFAIRQFANLQHERQRQLTHNHSQKEENKGKKKRKERMPTRYLRRLTPSCTHFQLIIDLTHLLSWLPCLLLTYPITTPS